MPRQKLKGIWYAQCQATASQFLLSYLNATHYVNEFRGAFSRALDGRQSVKLRQFSVVWMSRP